MIEAMNQMKNITQVHYIVLIENFDQKSNNETNDELQRKIRYELWLKELNRIGIREVVVKDPLEFNDLLEEISLKSRWKNVYITGAHKENNIHTITLAKEIGNNLAKIKDVSFVYGQSEGIGMEALSGFMEQCIKQKSEIGNRIKMYPNPYAVNHEFSDKKELLPLLKKERYNLFTDVRTVILFKGGMGTNVELDIAQENMCEIFPVIIEKEDYHNEIIKRCLNDIQIVRKLEKNVPDYWNILINKDVPPHEILFDAIEKMIG